MWDIGLTLLGGAVHLTALFVVLVEEQRRPSATLAWILAILFLPFLGVGLYFLIGRTRASRIAVRSERSGQRIRAVLEKHSVHATLAAGAERIDARTESLLRLGASLSTTPASYGNEAEILVDGEAAYRSMLEAGAAAKDHIHVQFYIIEPDETGTRLRDQLVRRAREEVEVRVLYDAVGSSSLPGGFWDPLRDVSGKAAVFEPVFAPWRRRKHYRVDFRNHRKIVVVDGHVGFTGGINVGSEYLGHDPTLGKWRDTHIRLEGPAALSLQATFAEDWYSATGELLDDERYFPPSAGDGPSVVEIVDSGPDRTWSPIAHVFSHAIALSRERVWITNPYFVPGPYLEKVLIGAALRGVDVRLLLPGISDNWLIQQVTRSYYHRFLEAGARIFEYERGFVHAKTMAIDSWVCTVGSANMDTRSFQLNFELNAFVHDAACVGTLAKQFEEDLRHSTEVTLADMKEVRLPTRVVRAAARLLSPLL